MKNNYYKLLFCFIFIANGSLTFSQTFFPCANEFTERKEDTKGKDSKKDPLLEKKIAIHQELVERQDFKRPLQITIPVVFHVLQTPYNETFAMSDAWIMQQFNYLNWAIDQGNANNFFDIDFCLAQFDDANSPMPIPGIDRINLTDNLTYTSPITFEEILHYNTLTSSIMPTEIWDPNKYYNIWLCPVLQYGFGFGGYISGISHFPANAGLEGIDIGSDQLNTNFLSSDLIDGSVLRATSANSYDALIAHETGHWLGGLHTFGNYNTCDPGDYCADTEKETAYHSCFSDQNTCGDPDPLDNFSSYHFNCANTFTKDQNNTRFFQSLMNDPMRYSVWQHTYLCNSKTWFTAQIAHDYDVFCAGDSILFEDYIDVFVPSNFTVYYSISTDGGNTWSIPTTTPFSFAGNPIQDYVIRVSVQTSNGLEITLGELDFTAYTIADCNWPPNNPNPHDPSKKSIAINAFPNPAFNLIHIQTDEVIEQILVANATKTKQVKYNNTRTLDLSSFDSGILFIQVQFKDGQTKVLKVIKN